MRGMTVVEGDMVGQARDGDLAAFDSLVRSYYRRLLGFALRHVSQFDAEETVQETFLKAFGALPRLRQIERFRPWLFRCRYWKNCYHAARGNSNRGRQTRIQSRDG